MRLYTLLLLAIAGALSHGTVAHAQSLIACGPSDSPIQSAELTGIRRLLADSSKDGRVFRGLAHLPSVAANDVTIVTDTTICDAVAHAVATHVGAGAPAVPVWVIAVGSTRLIAFGRIVSGGRAIASTFDTSYSWLADFLQ